MEKIEYYHNNSEILAYEKVINSGGDWIERTYDENGRELTFKNSGGEWYKITYDEDGNRVTYKDSNGYWFERTYDENGKELTYKNSNGHYRIKGKVVTEEEFENFQNKPCLGKTVIIDGIEYTLS